MSKLFSPVFAKGKGQATTITSFTTGDPCSCVVADKTGFVAGNHMFISHANNTVYEYLGTLVSAATTTFTFTLGSSVTRASGAKLWAAAAVFQADSVPAPQKVTPEIATGVLTVQGIGIALNTAVAPQREYRAFTLRQVTAVECQEWFTFFTSTLSNGLKTFTCAWYDSHKAAKSTYKVQVQNPADVITVEAIPGELAAIDIRVELLTANTYV